MINSRSRVPVDITVVDLNQTLAKCSGDVTITEIFCLYRTERGDEYTVLCGDQEKTLIQHFCGKGITWVWEENYEEFIQQLRYM